MGTSLYLEAYRSTAFPPEGKEYSERWKHIMRKGMSCKLGQVFWTIGVNEKSEIILLQAVVAIGYYQYQLRHSIYTKN